MLENKAQHLAHQDRLVYQLTNKGLICEFFRFTRNLVQKLEYVKIIQISDCLFWLVAFEHLVQLYAKSFIAHLLN